MRRWKFEVKPSSDGQWMFNIISSNGKIVATSELYKQQQSAIKTISSIKANAAFADLVEKTPDESGE